MLVWFVRQKQILNLLVLFLLVSFASPGCYFVSKKKKKKKIPSEIITEQITIYSRENESHRLISLNSRGANSGKVQLVVNKLPQDGSRNAEVTLRIQEIVSKLETLESVAELDTMLDIISGVLDLESDNVFRSLSGAALDGSDAKTLENLRKAVEAISQVSGAANEEKVSTFYTSLSNGLDQSKIDPGVDYLQSLSVLGSEQNIDQLIQVFEDTRWTNGVNTSGATALEQLSKMVGDLAQGVQSGQLSQTEAEVFIDLLHSTGKPIAGSSSAVPASTNQAARHQAEYLLKTYLLSSSADKSNILTGVRAALPSDPNLGLDASTVASITAAKPQKSTDLGSYVNLSGASSSDIFLNQLDFASWNGSISFNFDIALQFSVTVSFRPKGSTASYTSICQETLTKLSPTANLKSGTCSLGGSSPIEGEIKITTVGTNDFGVQVTQPETLSFTKDTTPPSIQATFNSTFEDWHFATSDSTATLNCLDKETDLIGENDGCGQDGSQASYLQNGLIIASATDSAGNNAQVFKFMPLADAASPPEDAPTRVLSSSLSMTLLAENKDSLDCRNNTILTSKCKTGEDGIAFYFTSTPTHPNYIVFATYRPQGGGDLYYESWIVSGADMTAQNSLFAMGLPGDPFILGTSHNGVPVSSLSDPIRIVVFPLDATNNIPVAFQSLVGVLVVPGS